MYNADDLENVADGSRKKIPSYGEKVLPCSGRYIGVDIGGTKIAGALIRFDADGGCRVLGLQRVKARRGNKQVLEDVNRVVRLLSDCASPSALAEANHGEDCRIRGIGLGIPGRVDSQTGVVANVANLDISNLSLGDEIAKLTGLPAHVVNDVNAAAFGAYAMLGQQDRRFAQTQSEEDVIAFLNLGTGLAAGVLRNGMLDHGFSGVVGEIGHIPVERHGWACGCGQKGCLETAAGGNGIKRMWPQADPPMPDIIAKSHDVSDPEHHAAIETLATVIGAIADTIDILAMAVDPRIIMIGGGTAKTGKPLLDEIRAELLRRGRDSAFIASLKLENRLVLADPSQPIGCIGAGYAMARTINE
ncbi:ROK family protein [Bifidobacterium sp. ESL0704]|uniref:ROK family protein n=1 Tax=Bifidobacterium sp. ESL0704 TaxID=2983219 RepID=UPI0023F916AD|nr:ROK family protein [Bifidobacterium sp. ESL0704]WEV53468.1 ROK family protein [Bifidobacterium sp. ESL0704]